MFLFSCGKGERAGRHGEGAALSSPPNKQGCGEAVEALSGEGTKYRRGFEKAIVMLKCDLNNKRQKECRRGQMCFTNTRSGLKDVAQKWRENTRN